MTRAPSRAHPFALPDFYMPYAARLNPYLERARAHTKAWSYAMGILGEGAVWDEATFDAMDFAQFTAQTHPDVSGETLDVLTDWFVWGWFVDDYFPHAYGRGADERAAKAYLERLLAFMPVDLDASVPDPANPAELAAADLWPRTGRRMSAAWRRRFVDHIAVMADATLWEVAGQRRDRTRTLDPLEFIAMRREISGMPWAADLVEFSLQLELPPELHRARPIRVINDVYADSGGMRNDILSYPHDAADDTRNNAVMVVEAFLGCSLQRAVDVVDDMATARMFALEHAVAVELPAHFEAEAVPPATRTAALRYVRAIQDWLAGEHKWAIRPGGRYVPSKQGAEPPRGNVLTLANALIGPGTASLHLAPANLLPGARRLAGYRLTPPPAAPPRPALTLPFPARLNPHARHAEAQCAAWCRSMGLLNGAVWDEAAYAQADPAGVAARLYPDLSAEALANAAAWTAWIAWADDDFRLRFVLPRNVPAAQLQARRLAQVVEVGLAPVNTVERALAALWAASSQTDALRRGLDALLSGWLWELVGTAERRVPDTIDHAEMRRGALGCPLRLAVAQHAAPRALPQEVLGAFALRSLRDAAFDAVALMGDLFGYPREVARDGEVCNGVLVAHTLLGVDIAQAQAHVAALANARVRQFEHVRDVGLPPLLDEHAPDAASRDAADALAQSLQDLMAGCLHMFERRA